jgi:hypothetical protein
MKSKKELFLDKKLRCGGFYELAIQVCKSDDILPIRLYTDFLWSRMNVDGPFDLNFNHVKIELENIRHNGIVNLENYSIPFITYHILEEHPIESGSNWFGIGFYTAAIEEIFGEQYTTWTEIQNCPELISNFLSSTMKSLFEIYPFKLAMIDFEISGQYYLEDLKGEFKNFTYSKFYIADENINEIAEQNKKFVTIVY